MTQRFDLIDLQLFLHIADSSTITHGAERANMSLAAASERVRAMEDALGAPLLERKRRGVELTPAGSALVHHAAAVVHQLEQMRGELGSYAQGLRACIRLLCINVNLFDTLPPALSRFLSAHPHVDIDLKECFKSEIIREIDAGHADIGLFRGTVDSGAALETFSLAESRLVLVVPPAHPLGQLREISFQSALDQEFISLSSHNPLQRGIEHQAQLAGQRLISRVRTTGFDAMCQLVASGIGVAAVPEAVARRWERAAPLKIIALTDPWTTRRVTACVKSLKSLSPHSQRLLEYLRS